MGGRGAKSHFISRVDQGALPYRVTSWTDYANRAVLPFADYTGKAWHILRHDSDKLHVESEFDPSFTFGLSSPTLRWVNGNQVVNLYVAGMDTEQFLDAAGLRLDMSKGGFVLSKRISRVFRPQRFSGMFDAGNVRVSYMGQTDAEAKIWDGAGLVSRSFLEGMALAGDLPEAGRDRLQMELRRMQRVEFTILTDKGEDKGHCLVAEDLRDDRGNPIDFLLPEDTKAQVKLMTGETFVGLNPVHGHNDMRLDVQSLINLTPFFDPDELLGYVKDEGELFLSAIESGDVSRLSERVRGLNTGATDHQKVLSEAELAEIGNQWPVKALIAAGLNPGDYRSPARSLVNQHLERLNHQTLEKLRLPLPGGRHYVMPIAVAKRAGLDEVDAVDRGEIFIDDKRATAWVNDDDWLAMRDSDAGNGIVDILGGADNDDGLWLYGFTDHDGEQKVLTWRSPNQVGEYVVLRPTVNSAELQWQTAKDEKISYPLGDSRKLPQRIDAQSVTYEGAVEPETAGGIGEDAKTYTVEAMDAAIRRSVANEGVLGAYCNALMLHQGLFGRIPDTLPAPLEDVIDASVKTGADVSAVRDWCHDHSRTILEQRTPIPDLLHKRLSVDYSLPPEEQPPSPRRIGSENHWLARLQQGIQTHIVEAEQRRDELLASARPPEALFDVVAEDAEGLQLGRELNRRFGAALNKAAAPHKLLDGRRAVEEFLTCFDPPMQRRILRGALASAYLDEAKAKSDAAVWLALESEMGREKGDGFEQLRQIQESAQPGQWRAVGVRMVDALRELDLPEKPTVTSA